MLWGKSIKEYEEFLIKTEKPYHKEIYNDYIEGMTPEELSFKYNISIPAINLALRKHKDLNEFRSV
jgi:Mor family transcriptional regulator